MGALCTPPLELLVVLAWAAIGKIKGGASYNQYQSFSGKILPHFLVFTIFVAQKMAKIENFQEISDDSLKNPWNSHSKTGKVQK